jgi:hypothetical protein
MKKAVSVLSSVIILICGCNTGERGDKYGNSRDSTGHIYSNSGAAHETTLTTKPDYTEGARPEPDTSSFYDNSTTKKESGKEHPKK